MSFILFCMALLFRAEVYSVAENIQEYQKPDELEYWLLSQYNESKKYALLAVAPRAVYERFYEKLNQSPAWYKKEILDSFNLRFFESDSFYNRFRGFVPHSSDRKIQFYFFSQKGVFLHKTDLMAPEQLINLKDIQKFKRKNQAFIRFRDYKIETSTGNAFDYARKAWLSNRFELAEKWLIRPSVTQKQKQILQHAIKAAILYRSQ